MYLYSPFGDYVLVRELGRGGFGTVWLAQDTTLQRRVALKILKGQEPDEVARFKREALLAAGLSHPNIAAVYGVGEVGGEHFLALQFVDGDTLTVAAGHARRLRLTPRESLEAIRDAGDGALECVFGSRDKILSAVSARDGRLLWEFETGGVIDATPVFADVNLDGVLDAVVGSWDRSVYAASCRDAPTIWEVVMPNTPASPPAIVDVDEDGLPDVIVASHLGGISAFSGRSGMTLWSKPEGGHASFPESADPIVMGTDEGMLQAYDPRSGSILWSYAAGAKLNDQATPFAGGWVAGAVDGTVHAVDAHGRGRWTAAVGGAILGAPGVAGDRCVVGTRDGNVVAFSSAGERLWAFKAAAPVEAPIAGGAGFLAATTDGAVHALSLDGVALWSFKAGMGVYAMPRWGDLTGDGVAEAVFGSIDRHVYALDGRTGRPLWTFRARLDVVSVPVLRDVDGDGLADVVIGSDDASVYALRGFDGRLLWSIATGSDVRFAVGLADFDGDGGLDCAIYSEDATLYAVSVGSRSLPENPAARLAWHEAWTALAGMEEAPDLLRGRALVMPDRGADSRAVLERAVEALPRSVEALVLFASAGGGEAPLAKALDLDAVRAYDAALDFGVAGRLPRIEMSGPAAARAVALLWSGRAAEARALLAGDDDADLMRMRGRAALEAGDPDAALADWERIERTGIVSERLRAWIAEARAARAGGKPPDE